MRSSSLRLFDTSAKLSVRQEMVPANYHNLPMEGSRCTDLNERPKLGSLIAIATGRIGSAPQNGADGQ